MIVENTTFKMTLKCLLGFLVTLTVFVDRAFSCKIDANLYKKYTPIERMLLSQNVIYGKDLNHVEVNESEYTVGWAQFDSYTILEIKRFPLVTLLHLLT